MNDLTTRIEDQGPYWQLSLLKEGEAVSGVGIVKSRIRIGKAAVRMAGIAGLWTAPEHRLKGYGSRSMWEAIRLMETEGCDTSVLFGIKDFYGFAPVYPDVSLSLATTDLPIRTDAKVRPMRRADLRDVVRLYNRHSGWRTGMVVRDADWSPKWRMPGMGEGTDRRAGRVSVVCPPSGRAAAYFVADIQAGRFDVSEVGVSDHWSCRALAGALRSRAARHGVERIRVHVPADDAFAGHCIAYGCEQRTSHPRNAGSMGRIVRLAPLFRKLLPTLSQRWAESGIAWTRPIELRTDIGRVRLEAAGDRVLLVPDSSSGCPVVARIPALPLSQLVFGYRSAADIAHDSEVRLPRAAQPILHALFPRELPYMWWSDRF